MGGFSEVRKGSHLWQCYTLTPLAYHEKFVESPSPDLAMNVQRRIHIELPLLLSYGKGQRESDSPTEERLQFLCKQSSLKTNLCITAKYYSI